jgi:leucyl aminopeptidase
VPEFRAGGSAAEETADGLVVGVGGGRTFDETGRWLLERLPWLAEAMEDADFEGRDGQSFVTTGAGTVPYRRLVFAGLGDDPDAETVRRRAGDAARNLRRARVVATTLHVGAAGAAEAVGLGFPLGGYVFDRHKSEQKPSSISEVVLLGADEDAVSAAGRGAIVASGVALARDLTNEPGGAKPPAILAERIRDMAEEVGLAVRILDEDDIAVERLGGLRGVGMGSASPPRLVELRYEPEDAVGFLAFVGKGIVFDSGGLSLKPTEAMQTMKTDMAGAAAVAAATRVVAALGLPVRILAIAPLAENMPSGEALRPGDVVTARNGTSIEVMDTDAEGRVVLADGLSLAAEARPDLIVDMATLTGACKVALGEKIAGLMGSDDAVALVQRAADRAGERVWRLPLPADYRKMIDSDVADVKNVGGKFGGAITAALFLKEFVGDVPWAHLDIAGPARSQDVEDYVGKGGTGFGVRTLVELARLTAEDQPTADG